MAVHELDPLHPTRRTLRRFDPDASADANKTVSVSQPSACQCACDVVLDGGTLWVRGHGEGSPVLTISFNPTTLWPLCPGG